MEVGVGGDVVVVDDSNRVRKWKGALGPAGRSGSRDYDSSMPFTSTSGQRAATGHDRVDSDRVLAEKEETKSGGGELDERGGRC